MDVLCRPRDGFLRVEVGDKSIDESMFRHPCGHADLDGDIRTSRGDTCGLEVDRGEAALRDGWGRVNVE